MSNIKSRWTQPQLIVLTRGNPEESVLTHCKAISPTLNGPNGRQQDGCNELQGGACQNCQSRSDKS